METKIRIRRDICYASLLTLLAIPWPVGYGAGIYSTIGSPALSKSNLAEGGGRLYEVYYGPEEFTGDLIARSISKDGKYVPDDFDAGGSLVTFNGIWRARLTVDKQSQRHGGGSSDSRVIITSGSDGVQLVGRRFDWDHSNNGLTLNDGANEDLKGLVDPDATAADKKDPNYNDPIVSWIRGSDEFEGTGSTELRQRQHVLSSIGHSSPQYVGPPHRLYTFDNYKSFRSGLSSRISMVYVGSSMLHGFNADDGTEVFAYIPHEILGRLKGLTAQYYTETLLVDGTPTVADAHGSFATCTSKPCWKTILIGSLGVGGKSIFALDVTDPVSLITNAIEPETEAASNLFLWEFDDADLGLTTARPIVGRLGDGTWVAIFGNGRGTSKATLFIVDIATGALIQKLELFSKGNGNGLSSPIAWDSDFDDDVDYVYAGDLEGNLWRFDFSNATATGGANISLSDEPLVSVIDPNTGADLPITTTPVVSLHPDDGVLVYFGTSGGGQHNNGLFGIQDVGVAHGVDPPLVVRTINTVPHGPDHPEQSQSKYRIIASTTTPENPVGWKLELPVGERILNEPILNNKRISFTSTNGVVENFNHNWFSGVDFLTGGAPALPFLDLNDDGHFDQNDLLIDIDDELNRSGTVVPIGRFLDVGVVSGPVPANVDNGRDTVFITHGLESLRMSQLMFGLPGGHFDQDTFSISEAVTHEHTHAYDDRYNIDGVNMLSSGGVIANPPEVENATGILSQNRALQDWRNQLDDQILLRVINPYSVDTPKLAAQRAGLGLDSTIAPHAMVFYQCGQAGERYILPAPSFNSLPQSDRTCVLNDIQELRIKFASINALRATTPDCVQANETGPILGDPAVGLNGSYRDGAITVQAVRVSDNEVVWEHVNYEHLDDTNIRHDLVPNNRPGGKQVQCGLFNEDLRVYVDLKILNSDKNATKTEPARGTGSSVVTVSTRGTQLTKRIDIMQSSFNDGRVSWREVLK